MRANHFDELLQASDPTVSLTAAERRLVSKMVRGSTPRNWRSRPVATIALVALLLGGGGTAVAAIGLWSPWAQNDAFAKLTFELPNGTECEYRLGDMRDAPEEVQKVIQEAFLDYELDEKDISDAAAYLGITENPITDDEKYARAARWAAALRVEKTLNEHGLKPEYQFSGEGFCS
ncbi:MAG: hypothetical protein ACTIJ6_11150 [Leucobacter sp.]